MKSVLAATIALPLLSATAGLALAEKSEPPRGRVASYGVDPVTEITAAGAVLSLNASQGKLLRSPRPVHTVYVADEDIADVEVRDPLMIFIHGKKGGSTTLYLVDAEDQVILNARVTVQPIPVMVFHGSKSGPEQPPTILQLPPNIVVQQQQNNSNGSAPGPGVSASR